MNVNVAELEFVIPIGVVPVIPVSGANGSTNHVTVSGVASTLPATSTARTTSVCVPCARPAKNEIASHGAYPAPSRSQSNAFGLRPGSLEEKLKPAVVLRSNAGGWETTFVVGAVWSSAKLYAAGVGSTSEPFFARARNVWVPSPAKVNVSPEEHAA